GLPPRAESGDLQRSEQLLTRVSGEVQQRVDLGDAHLFRTGGQLDDLVARLQLALFEHAKVEARPAARNEQRRNARVVHSDPDAIASPPGLRDLEHRAPDLVSIADAHLIVAQPLDGEVLAELSVDEVASLKFPLPVSVGVDLVDEHGTLLAAMT